jgi:hypothetical protein
MPVLNWKIMITITPDILNTMITLVLSSFALAMGIGLIIKVLKKAAW